MKLRQRHAIPATMLESGRVITRSGLELIGPAESLTGFARWREVYARWRLHHSRLDSLRVTVMAWRTGVVLDGHPVGVQR